MFYVTNVNSGICGVMDTTDNVEEFYDVSKVVDFRKQGIVIHNQSCMKEFLVFIWSFMLNSREFGADEFEDVISFMEDKCTNRFYGSRYDYANSLKESYINVKSLGFNIDLRNILNSSDLLISDLCNLYVKNRDYGTFNANLSRQRCSKVALKWKLSEKDVEYYFAL